MNDCMKKYMSERKREECKKKGINEDRNKERTVKRNEETKKQRA